MSKTAEKLLIVDDNEDIRNQLRWGLDSEYNVFLAGRHEEALSLFIKHRPKVTLLDLGLPPHEESAEEGFRCLEDILKIRPLAKIIIVTGNEERENALKAVQTGAYDFYQKPIDLKELKIIIKRAFHLYGLEEENRKLHTALDNRGALINGIIGECPKMLDVFSTIRKVASSDAPVLIQGESGTGKELVAKAIYSLSLRKDKPFIPINCGAIPENLLESELFGYEKGAFTGAYTKVHGKVEYAHKGTLFLDEIGELPYPLQVKLLRFLQEKTIQRVGGREDIHTDTRIIAATNKNLTKEIQKGRFREDLFYRIGVVTINLPPLRERKDDIMILANLFLQRFKNEFSKKIKGFEPLAIEMFKSYPWPGNVRELENRIQRAVLMSETPLIMPQDLDLTHTEKPWQSAINKEDSRTLKEIKEKIERDIIVSVMEKHDGQISKVADELGVARPTLYGLMKKYDIKGVDKDN